ncbi:MAG TPA: VIT family protein [Hyphomonadaceae bacterium]|nr:VIT family protein [Hyphomonadaceae bacterium]
MARTRVHTRGHRERHVGTRTGWLRAAVLGANDGILSTASLVVGVAASGASQQSVLISGVAGLVAGAMSMAAGEYVSVSSQADAENADLAREKRELHEEPEAERQELTQIYVDRGLDRDLARQVADQLTARNALEAHARDELGINEFTTARPIQAAFASALSFSVGAAMPIIVAALSPRDVLGAAVAIATAPMLTLLGYLGARAGNSNVVKPMIRVTLWGLIAMAAAALVGKLFNVQV